MEWQDGAAAATRSRHLKAPNKITLPAAGRRIYSGTAASRLLISRFRRPGFGLRRSGAGQAPGESPGIPEAGPATGRVRVYWARRSWHRPAVDALPERVR